MMASISGPNARPLLAFSKVDWVMIWTLQRGPFSVSNLNTIKLTDIYTSTSCNVVVICCLLSKTQVQVPGQVPGLIQVKSRSGPGQVRSRSKLKDLNQLPLYRFDVVYLHNLVGPCSPWVWVLECWNFFPDLLTYVSTWGLQRFLIWELFILRPEAAWECLRNCDLQTKYKL